MDEVVGNEKTCVYSANVKRGLLIPCEKRRRETYALQSALTFVREGNVSIRRVSRAGRRYVVSQSGYRSTCVLGSCETNERYDASDVSSVHNNDETLTRLRGVLRGCPLPSSVRMRDLRRGTRHGYTRVMGLGGCVLHHDGAGTFRRLFCRYCREFLRRKRGSTRVLYRLRGDGASIPACYRKTFGRRGIICARSKE